MILLWWKEPNALDHSPQLYFPILMNRLRNKKFILFSFLISEKLNSVFDFVSGTLQRTTIHYRTTYYTLWRLTSIIAHSSPLLPPSLPPSLLPYPTLPRFFLLPYPILSFLVSFSYRINCLCLPLSSLSDFVKQSSYVSTSISLPLSLLSYSVIYLRHIPHKGYIASPSHITIPPEI